MHGAMRLPWYVWTSAAAVTCIVVGTYWDISWHMSIGRDSFWTPAHIAIQLGGIIAGAAGTALILTTTFRGGEGIRVWGFRGPFGAFLSVWGGATMLVSAPFDNWWHAAYGLDVKILSPPHAVLTLGVLGVSVGSAMLIVSELNRAVDRGRLRTLLLVVGGEIFVLAMMAILESTFRANLHRAESYRAVAIVAPIGLVAIAQASGARRGATAVAGVYTAVMIGLLWLFPRFPAEAKLGPVYQPITHFIPLEFPLLVIAGAIAIDVVRARTESWRRLPRGLVIGVVFVVAFVAVEWPVAMFLSSPASHGWVFGTDYFPYFARPEWHSVRGEFLPESTTDLVIGMAEALGAAGISAWIGLVVGDALARVRR
jgi:hypothetical protein